MLALINSRYVLSCFIANLILDLTSIAFAAWKVSKYGVISGPYFPAFRLNTERYYLSVFKPNAGKCGPEITPYLDTFHTLPWLRISDVLPVILAIIHAGLYCLGWQLKSFEAALYHSVSAT